MLVEKLARDQMDKLRCEDKMNRVKQYMHYSFAKDLTECYYFVEDN